MHTVADSTADKKRPSSPLRKCSYVREGAMGASPSRELDTKRLPQ